MRNRLRDTEKLPKIRKFFQQNTKKIFWRLAALFMWFPHSWYAPLASNLMAGLWSQDEIISDGRIVSASAWVHEEVDLYDVRRRPWWVLLVLVLLPDYIMITNPGYVMITDPGYMMITDPGYMMITDLDYMVITDRGYVMITDQVTWWLQT